MYQCTLRFCLSPHPLLEAALRKADPLPGFRHEISVVDGCDMASIANADVVFLGPKELAALPTLRQKLPKVLPVLVHRGDEPLPATLNDLLALDDIWALRDEPALCAFHVARLLDRIRQHKDHALTRQYLDATLNTSSAMVWFKDRQGNYFKVNKNYARIMGVDYVESGARRFLVQKNNSAAFAQCRDICTQSDQYVLTVGRPGIFVENVPTDGGLRQLKVHKAPLFAEDGTIMGIVGIGYDITDFSTMNTEVGIFLRSLPFPILLEDSGGCVTHINEKFQELFELRPEDKLVGQSSQQIFDLVTERFGIWWEKNNTEAHFLRDAVENVLLRHDSRVFDAFDKPVGTIIVLWDVSLERRYEWHLQNKARTDDLTGLSNRRSFYDLVPAFLEPGAALIYVDLDNFKDVNDQHGHHMGDQALILTAGVLSANFPGSVITRMGGDEFVIFLPSGCTRETFLPRAQSLLDNLHNAFAVRKSFHRLSASVGVCLVEEDGLSRDELVRRGDVAMYAAKSQGKRRFCVYSEDLADKRNPKTSCRQRPRPLSGSKRIPQTPVSVAPADRQ